VADREEKRFVDLSHVIEHGMTTYEGLPGPHICDFWTREGSAANYDDGSSFQIGRIDMVANTGTYLDTPFHRYADGADLAELPLPSLADLPAIVIRRPWENSRAIDSAHFDGRDVAGKAVLVHTGWDRHWRTDAYFGDHPFLTAAAADWLADHGAALVGIDSCNIDNMHVRARPVHTRLLAAAIPICEHMTRLETLPDQEFRFSAVPPKVKGMGTFPVRAYAVLG
jgi:arylformamidase